MHGGFSLDVYPLIPFFRKRNVEQREVRTNRHGMQVVVGMSHLCRPGELSGVGGEGENYLKVFRLDLHLAVI